MSLQDSDALIAQWHAAVGREREADRALLVEYARELRNALNERSAIRNLATNPLLCAMLCALNWDRRKSLPNDRMLLYQLALDMLLEGRDAEREVQGARVRIEKSDKEALLDAIAYWMMRNGYAEADLDGVLDEVARQLPRLSRIPKSVTPELIVQELLERSGVLRQPQHGIIDFIHRTFLEYMGARAAVRAGDAGLLQGKARDESWRETIVFAVGHATGRERDELVRGLLKKRLWGSRPLEAAVLLACCLETAAQSLEPLLLLELRTIAKQLFPPRDLETAPLLAHAAAIDPDVLEGHSELVHVAACIRIAAIVGGSRMLNVIAGYAHIEPVEGEIVNAWDAYDQDVFVEVVLRNRATLLGISLADLDGQDFSCLRFLVGMGYQRSGGLESLLDEFRRTRSLDVSIERRIPGLAAIGSPTVSRLGLADVKRLARLSSLRALTIEIQGDLLHPLGALENLEELHVRIAGPPQAISLAPFLACKRLKTLMVSGATLLDVEVLVALSSLNRLQLLSCDGIRNRSLASLSQLMELVLDGEDWPLELELPVNLVRLGARHGAGSRRLQARGGPVRLQTMHRLQALDADESTMEYGRFAHLLKQVTITSVDPLPVSISVSTSCESLMLRVPIVDFLSLRHHANLESIDLSQVGEVRDPKSLFTLPRLKALVVSSARPVINDSVMSLLKARGVQVTSA